jgi:lysozyme family protein
MESPNYNVPPMLARPEGYIPRLQEKVGTKVDNNWGPESGKALVNSLQSTELGAEPITPEEVIGAVTDATVAAKETEQNTLIDSVFHHEGGYSGDKKDTGNWHNKQFIGTNHGISAPVLAEHLGRQPTVKDMKDLTKAEASAMYKKDYYDKYGIGSLPKDLQEIVLHSVVNSGRNGIKVVQELLGTSVDGSAGPNTKAAMSKAKFTKQEFKDRLMKKYKGFKTWKTHGKGWDRRFQELADK